MIKPIFTIGLPIATRREDFESISNMLSDKFSDYNVLIYISNLEESKFEAFYEKDFNEVKFEELKQIVLDNFK